MLLFVFSAFALLFSSATVSSPTDSDLADILLQNYSKKYRPVRDIKTTVEVHIFPIVYAIVQLDELRESLTLMIWQGFRWNDEYLAWDNRSLDWYEEETVNIPIELIWIPDVVVFNVLEKTEIIERERMTAVVHRNGTVYANFPLLLTFRCIFDISDFPFDTQNCTLTYGSWSFQKKQLTILTGLAPVVTDLEDFVLKPHNEWDAISIVSQQRTIQYADATASMIANATWSELDFTLTVKRKPAYYVYVLILPTFVIAQINIVGLFTPHNSRSEREEKVSLGLTTLLAIAVILNIVTDRVPRSKFGLPLLGNYVLFEIFISVAGIIITVLIMFVHEKMLLYKVKPPRILLFWRMNKISSLSTALNKESPENRPEREATADRQRKDSAMEAFEEQWAKFLGICDMIMMTILFFGNIIGTWIMFF